MPRNRLFAALLFALLFAGLVGACQRSGPSDVGRTEEGVLRLGSVEAVDTVARAVAPNERPLVLEGMRGSVHLTGASQTTADLSFVRRGRGESPEAARSVLEEVSITEQGTSSAYTFTLAAEQKEDYAAVDVRGQVPRQATLEINRMSGPVHVEGVEGALTITHQHGSVEVWGAAAPVEVDVENGNVHVGFQTVPDEGTVRLRTRNGDIRVGLPPGASAQIDARTDIGVIRARGVSLTEEHLSPVDAGARYEAQVEEGGATFELRTENGSITILAADTTGRRLSAPHAPAEDSLPVTTPDTVITPPSPSPDTGIAQDTVPSGETPVEDDTSARDTTGSS